MKANKIKEDKLPEEINDKIVESRNKIEKQEWMIVVFFVLAILLAIFPFILDINLVAPFLILTLIMIACSKFPIDAIILEKQKIRKIEQNYNSDEIDEKEKMF